MIDARAGQWLVCRVGARWCALALEHVVETMRPLPVEHVAGAPGWVRGLTVIRGEPVPVLDTARLLGATETAPQRFVAVRAGSRLVALAVDGVLGVRATPPGGMAKMAPLLQDAGAERVAAIGTLDAELLLVLDGARLVPEDLWAQLETEPPP